METMVSRRLAVLLVNAQMNASQLAKASGTHRSYVRRILRGERVNPGAHILRKWASALGCSESAFFE